MEDKVQIIILAAGLGKRMGNQQLPKALAPLKGKPLIFYILNSIKELGVCEKPAIVVGTMAELVKKTLGSDYIYILQSKQLGTGHAVMAAKDEFANKADNILVLYSDQPLISKETIKRIVDAHLAKGNVLTMGTVLVADFEKWRAGFYDFGRIVRDKNGKLRGIVEKKDATSEQLQIKELNPSYFCFKAGWLWKNLDEIKNNNSQGEYYLTDLIDVAVRQKQEISTVAVEPKEALGINNKEQLKLIEKLI